MDVVLIFNGLGNQMSQFALYLSKSHTDPNTRLLFSKKSVSIHNGFELHRVFGIKITESFSDRMLFQLFKLLTYQKYPFLSRPLIKLLKRLRVSIVSENDDYNFHPEVLEPSRGIRFFVGGWHAEKYFLPVKSQVIKTFQFDTGKIGDRNQAVLQQITDLNSVSIHVRRGDFLDSDNYRKFGSVCTLEYFEKAIGRVRSLTLNPHFFFFTNDPGWVEKHFTGDSFTLVNINSGADSWKDMFLISRCKHHICSNGSFSWWSAWLDRREDAMVIVPKNFVAGIYFEDVYPDKWIRLADY